VEQRVTASPNWIATTEVPGMSLSRGWTAAREVEGYDHRNEYIIEL
jgi:hypothetical protein